MSRISSGTSDRVTYVYLRDPYAMSVIDSGVKLIHLNTVFLGPHIPQVNAIFLKTI